MLIQKLEEQRILNERELVIRTGELLCEKVSDFTKKLQTVLDKGGSKYGFEAQFKTTKDAAALLVGLIEITKMVGMNNTYDDSVDGLSKRAGISSQEEMYNLLFFFGSNNQRQLFADGTVGADYLVKTIGNEKKKLVDNFTSLFDNWAKAPEESKKTTLNIIKDMENDLNQHFNSLKGSVDIKKVTAHANGELAK